MAFHRTGQGATEYLIMLAAILIIALVALALLGFFPGLSSDAKVSQSSSYWRSEAKPIAIIEHHSSGYLDGRASTPSTTTLILQNVDASGTIRITNVTIAPSDPIMLTGFAFNDSVGKIGPGEQKKIFINNTEGGIVGTIYDFQINFTYTSANGVPTTQYGVKNLVGKYS